MRNSSNHGRQDSGPGTTKHYLTAARAEEKADRGKYDMFDKKRPGLPGWLMDKIAEEKLTGGYDTRKKNLCPNCFTYKSVNGSCGC